MIQVVSMPGVNTVWLRFLEVGVKANLTKQQCVDLAAELLTAAGGDL